MAGTHLDSDQIDARLAVLENSRDRAALAKAAAELASSSNPAGVMVVARFLGKPDFLSRLDDLQDPQGRFAGLSQVLRALEGNASEASGRLLEALVLDPDFLAEPDRKMFLLPALAAVRPMSRPAQDAFRAANVEGYVNMNGPLLVRNGSPRAFELFETMVADASIAPEDRVDMLHRAVLPHRVEGPVIAACERLLQAGLEPEVELGLIESIFDFREKEWFGVARHAPAPPSWSTAESKVLLALQALGGKLIGSGRLPPGAAQVVERTLGEIQTVLDSRPKW